MFCKLVRTELVLEDAVFARCYSPLYYGGGEAKFIRFAEILTLFFNYRRARSLLSYVNNNFSFSTNNPLKILDIGCGRANLLKILKRKGCDCYGTERTTFPLNNKSQGIHLFKSNLEDIFFTEKFFDVIIIWHALEHMDDPISVIKETARVLRPGGILTVAVPNFGSFQAGIFQKNWFHLDLPRHRYHFTSDTLISCLSKHGFKILRQHTFSLEQNPFGFIQSFFNKIMPITKPNYFYSLLKNLQGSSSILSFIFWVLFSIFIIPFAMLEYLISGLWGKGATLIIYAKKY